MSTNPFLAQAAQSGPAPSTRTEHASALDDLVGLDLTSPTLSTQSQMHASNALASPEATSGPSPFDEGPHSANTAFTSSSGIGSLADRAPASATGSQATNPLSGSTATSSYQVPSATGTHFPYAQSTYEAPSLATSPFGSANETNQAAMPSSSAYNSASFPTSTGYSTLAYDTTPVGTTSVANEPATTPFNTSTTSPFAKTAVQSEPAAVRTTNNPFFSSEPKQSYGSWQGTPALSYLAPAATGAAAAPVAAAATSASGPSASAGASQSSAPGAAPDAAPDAAPSAARGGPETQNQSQIDADEAIARALAQESSADEVQWPLKDISWNGRTTKIIMQNENGPCSLLALCNVLLLEQRLEITPADRPAVSYSYLSSKLTELLITQNTSNDPVQLSSALRALPSLQHGLDVNIGFASPVDFVQDTSPDALALFRLARVSLVHGWLPDPSDGPTYAALQRVGNYNAATLEVARRDQQPLGTMDVSAGAQPVLVQDFLEQNSTQLTPYGIAQLRQRMQPGSLAVLFRNSHLSVLYRSPHASGDPGLCTLVTDAGFLLEDRIVWESLQDPRGQYNAYFDSHLARAPYAPQRTRAQGTEGDSDYALAMELQNQERSRAMAARRRYREREAERRRTHPADHAADDAAPSSSSHGNPIQKIWTKIKRKV